MSQAAEPGSPEPAADHNTQGDDNGSRGDDPGPGSSPQGTRRADSTQRHPRVERLGERTEDFVDTVEQAIGRAVPAHIRLRERARHNTAVNVVWRAGVLTLGLLLIVGGMVMLVIPGPGWGAIILGLVVLATEYTWANRLLKPVRDRARAAAQAAARPEHRRLVIAALAIGAAAFLAGAWWYWTTYGLALPW